MEPLQPPPADDPRLAPLIAYLEEHREQINVEALRKQLRQAGHPPELVDEAVRRVMGVSEAKPLAWPLGLLVALGNLTVAPTVLGMFFGVVASLFPSGLSDIIWLPVVLLILLAAPIVELVVGRRLTGGPRDRLGRVLSWGAIITFVALGLFAVLFGICVAYISTLSFQ